MCQHTLDEVVQVFLSSLFRHKHHKNKKTAVSWDAHQSREQHSNQRNQILSWWRKEIVKTWLRKRLRLASKLRVDGPQHQVNYAKCGLHCQLKSTVDSCSNGGEQTNLQEFVVELSPQSFRLHQRWDGREHLAITQAAA